MYPPYDLILNFDFHLFCIFIFICFAMVPDRLGCPLEGYRADPGKTLSHVLSLKSGDHVPAL